MSSIFAKQGEAPFAKSVVLLHFLLARILGPVRTLIEGIGREGCVSCARAKAKSERPMCVGVSYRGNT
jgi:hypothetical protein